MKATSLRYSARRADRPESGSTSVPFTIVLAGGGARGYAHVGVLRALQHMGLAPAGLVGVSMGAVVAATYALHEDWYERLLRVDLDAFPRLPRMGVANRSSGRGIRRAIDYAQSAWNMVTGWGAPDDTADAWRAILATLLGSSRLDEGRIPVIVCATDLRSGERVQLRSGPAATAAYASSALAGVVPPLEDAGRVLADGAYTDVAPIDLARSMAAPIVIAVDPAQDSGAGRIANGLHALLRAMEICHHAHAHVRLSQADFVLRPAFGRFIDVLDFGARRECVAAGTRAVRSRAADLAAILHGGGPPRRQRDL